MNSTHPLSRWLHERKIKRKDFAIEIGVTAPHLSRILADTQRPSLDLVDRITQHTEGAITAQHFQRSAE